MYIAKLTKSIKKSNSDIVKNKLKVLISGNFPKAKNISILKEHEIQGDFFNVFWIIENENWKIIDLKITFNPFLILPKNLSKITILNTNKKHITINAPRTIFNTNAAHDVYWVFMTYKELIIDNDETKIKDIKILYKFKDGQTIQKFPGIWNMMKDDYAESYTQGNKILFYNFKKSQFNIKQIPENCKNLEMLIDEQAIGIDINKTKSYTKNIIFTPLAMENKESIRWKKETHLIPIFKSINSNSESWWSCDWIDILYHHSFGLIVFNRKWLKTLNFLDNQLYLSKPITFPFPKIPIILRANSWNVYILSWFWLTVDKSSEVYNMFWKRCIPYI